MYEQYKKILTIYKRDLESQSRGARRKELLTVYHWFRTRYTL